MKLVGATRISGVATAMYKTNTGVGATATKATIATRSHLPQAQLM